MDVILAFSQRTIGNDHGDEQFEHVPLPDPTSYIRLLEVESADNVQADVRCTLTTWHIAEAPIYHAISYTWGAKAPTNTVHVNEMPIMIRKSGGETLKQVRCFQSTRYYWLDMLCINQDDLSEKSYQVAIMGTIFRKAECVLMCLGFGQYRDCCTLKLLEDHDIELPQRARSPEERHGWVRLHAPHGHDQRLDEVQLIELLHTINDINQHEYFRRVWTFPEILLAQQLNICYGVDSCAFSLFRDVARSVGRAQKRMPREDLNMRRDADALPMRPGTRQGRAAVRDAPFPRIEIGSHLKDAFNIRDGSWADRKLPIDRALGITQRRDCQDRLDAIYSLLPLIDWGASKPPLPDYMTTPFRLAVTLAQNPTWSWKIEHILAALRLDPTDTAIAAKIRIRSLELVSSLPTSQRPKDAWVRRTYTGVRLDGEGPLRIDQHLPDDGLPRIANSLLLAVCGVASPVVREGDWITCSSLTAGLESLNAQPGLILREIGERFEIVGQAMLQGLNMQAWQIDGRPLYSSFDVYMDPIDFVVWSAQPLSRGFVNSATDIVENRAAPPHHIASWDVPLSASAVEKLSTGFCGADFSSFAVMSKRPLESSWSLYRKSRAFRRRRRRIGRPSHRKEDSHDRGVVLSDATSTAQGAQEEGTAGIDTVFDSDIEGSSDSSTDLSN